MKILAWIHRKKFDEIGVLLIRQATAMGLQGGTIQRLRGAGDHVRRPTGAGRVERPKWP